jgi:lambda family phage portal protein
MVDWRKLFGLKAKPTVPPTAGIVTPPSPEYGSWAGDKYHGGLGPAQLYNVDYWTLRERSGQLFRENLYARGIIRRIVTNEINTGLSLECMPDETILGMPEDSLTDWSDDVENRFKIWSDNPELCDFEGRRTFGELQREMRLEALVAGDILVVLIQNRVTRLPQIKLIDGASVQNPINQSSLRTGHTITDGVERDKNKRQVAYWVVNEDDNKSTRIPAFGPRSKRRVAWLVYGTEKRLNDVRGEPILSLILQSLKEVDRYRDAASRKATLNAILAWFVKKDEPKMGTLPAGGIRRGTVAVPDSTNPERRFAIADQIPGVVIEELQHGESPVPHSTAGTDVNFGPFEEAIIQACSWALEIPPEILRLTFSNNYSASQAAINEYCMTLNMKRMEIGETFDSPIYIEWLLSEVLLGSIKAPGLLEAWRDPREYQVYGAWVASDWTGAIKPSTDLVKQAKGYKMLKDECWVTNTRAARVLTGTSYRKNAKQIKRENELKVAAARPLAEFAQEFGQEEAAQALSSVDTNMNVVDIEELSEVVNG